MRASRTLPGILMQSHSINRYEIDWPPFRERALEEAGPIVGEGVLGFFVGGGPGDAGASSVGLPGPSVRPVSPPKSSGVGGLERMLLMEVMIHLVDTLRFLLGPLELRGARLGKDCEEIRGEDRATLMLISGGGAAVSLVGDFMAHGYPPQQVDRLEIFGSVGAILLRGDRLRLVGEAEEALTLDLPADYKASYRDAIAHFLARLRDGRPFETHPEDNLKTLEIVEAAYALGGWTK